MRTRVFSPTYPTWALVGVLQGQPAKLYLFLIKLILNLNIALLWLKESWENNSCLQSTIALNEYK